MKTTNWIITIILVVIGFAVGIFFVFNDEKALVVHPRGLIAHWILDLISTNVLLMLSIILPTLVILLMVAWHYRANNPDKKFDPKTKNGIFRQALFWIIPSIIVFIMAPITWEATHKLDPYRPIDSEVKPLIIQVVALNWKWLFIYPEQGIATVNFVQFPYQTPINFELTADESPMNSFWIPQLGGQIYTMTGMVTPLYFIADGPGEFSGKAAEINGEGYAKMRFVAASTSKLDFDEWTKKVKQSPLQLTHQVYEELVKPSENNPVTLYSFVEKNLFHKVVMKPYQYQP